MKKVVVLMAIMAIAVSACGVQAAPTAPALPTVTPTAMPIVVPTPTAVPTLMVGSRPATWIPTSLDEAWDFADKQVPGWYFIPCEPGQLSSPYITWGMAKEATEHMLPGRTHDEIYISSEEIRQIIAPGGGTFTSEGNVRIPENLIFGKLAQLTLKGELLSCGDPQGFPILFGDRPVNEGGNGNGIQDFLDWVATQSQ